MEVPLRILHLEDNPRDAELIKETLIANEIVCDIVRVDNRPDFEAALERGGFDLILSDYKLPSFDGIRALNLAREKCPTIPYIFVSGNIGEERAIETLKNGATDYILKEGLLRLASSIRRALREAEMRRNQQQLEEKLRQSQKMESIGRLAGGIAHDFNNLLTVISGYSEMFLEQMSDKDPYYKGLEEILNAAGRSSALTRQLLAFSRKQVLEPKVLDLNAAITNASQMFGRLIGENIELDIALAKTLGRVKVDPNQLEQVMLNLIINCRDAMPSGGKILIETKDVKIEETKNSDAKAGDYVAFSVKDSGIGMSEEVKKNIFEPFYTTKKEGKGTGLGLATVFGIVKQSSGMIEVETAVGKGTTFTVYFPRVNEELDVHELKAPVIKHKGSETILLVEDEPAVRLLTQRILEMNGYTVLVSSSGYEALSIFKTSRVPIHFLLTDLVMPQMSGEDLSREILKACPDMRVLYVSGYTEHVPDSQGASESRISFLQKPFTPNGLILKIREMLDAE